MQHIKCGQTIVLHEKGDSRRVIVTAIDREKHEYTIAPI